MTEISGSEKTLDCSLLLIAAGFFRPKPYIAKSFGAETDGRSNIATAAGSYKTSVDKLFTAGDSHRGQSLVVWAIAEGRAAAKEIDEYLMGYTNLV